MTKIVNLAAPEHCINLHEWKVDHSRVIVGKLFGKFYILQRQFDFFYFVSLRGGEVWNHESKVDAGVLLKDFLSVIGGNSEVWEFKSFEQAFQFIFSCK